MRGTTTKTNYSRACGWKVAQQWWKGGVVEGWCSMVYLWDEAGGGANNSIAAINKAMEQKINQVPRSGTANNSVAKVSVKQCVSGARSSKC